MAMGILNVPKCLYCPNDLLEGSVGAFCCVLTASDLQNLEVISSGFICKRCLDVKHRQIKELLEPKAKVVANKK